MVLLLCEKQIREVQRIVTLEEIFFKNAGYNLMLDILKMMGNIPPTKTQQWINIILSRKDLNNKQKQKLIEEIRLKTI